MLRSMIVSWCALALPAVVLSAETRWYVTTPSRSDPNASVERAIGAPGLTIEVGAGWTCTITEATPSGARTTTCRKGPEAFDFTVQCSPGRSEDHVQIRFRRAAGSPTFIEVGCRVDGR